MSFDPTAQPSLDKPPFASHPGVLSRLLVELGGAETVGEAAGQLFMLDPALALVALDAIAQLNPGEQLVDLHIGQKMAALEPVTVKSLVIASATEQLAMPAFSAEGLETAWRKALATAHFARALAEKSGYPGLDEAWLAGLMCWLPRFARNSGSDADGAKQLALAALDKLPLRTFLPDVLRYLNEPAQRLLDAAPLVRLAVAAYRQTMNYPAWIPALPHPDTLVLAAPIDRDGISEIYLAMGRAIDTLASESSFRQSGEIARELSRMSRLELVSGGHPQGPTSAVTTLADSLASQEGLGHALYLHRNPQNGALEGQSLGKRPSPPIAIKPEGSTTAAAWALLTRAPVVITLDVPADAAILDLQLIRQAGTEGLAAIPIGAGEPIGVLIVRGSRQALSVIAANPRHYARLGELAGRQPAPGQPVSTPAGNNGQLATRVRRAAHEINNPLGIVKNYLAIMKAKLGDEAPIADELRIMHEELDRIVRIIRGLTRRRPPSAPSWRGRHQRPDRGSGEGHPPVLAQQGCADRATTGSQACRNSPATRTSSSRSCSTCCSTRWKPPRRAARCDWKPVPWSTIVRNASWKSSWPTPGRASRPNWPDAYSARWSPSRARAMPAWACPSSRP
jgi:hypothetical protein